MKLLKIGFFDKMYKNSKYVSLFFFKFSNKNSEILLIKSLFSKAINDYMNNLNLILIC